ncbi:type VI secretion system Vgr family protein [Duganella callida]|uniref:Type VI secretion system tip protein VgrG n=1 Tax=Duganella callida TaxID=2561932 RepID=A0A4Y9SHV6_9BURK|nr:type VI secretion system tip protein VgrG [Duganella callida]TFW20079.1 type VI secretion system tip protein VgrG [Duganella callida]
MTTTQVHRELAFSCALGADTLLLRRMQGSEALSQLSEYILDLYSERSDLNIDDLLGTPATVAVDLPRGGKRYFSGIVTRFAHSGRQGRYATYQATMRPWFWLLTRSSDCRIFQEQNVLDIVRSVLAPYSVADIDTSALSGSYQPYDYCVQYRETDFQFLSRLLEREGIYYYFRSSAGRHTMMLCDSYAAHAPAPGYASLPYMPALDHAMRDSEVVYEWSMGGEIEPGVQALQDFDFEKPSSSLLVKSAVVRDYAHGRHALYDYPGGYSERAAGETYAGMRLDARQTSYRQVRAATRARGLYPGCLFSLSGHPRGDQNGEYLLTSAQYTLSSDTYEPVWPAEPGTVLSCSFAALARQTDFRPPRSTPKPVMQGPQTAIVVGKAGEEIWTDKYGRIKVQFHWDRLGREDESSSCWVRVAQGWAGKRWGSVFLPRVGQEVVVSFLEGDPDKPLVTGCVYNGDNMPPYALPAQASRSAIRSHSVQGQGYNELRFEDKRGAEQFYLRAERDLEQRVQRDALAWMGRDSHRIVKGDSYDQTAGDRHVRTGGDRRESVDGAVSLSSILNMQLHSGLISSLEAAQHVHIKAGMNVVIEAGASITLKAGSSFLTIGPALITASTMPVPLPAAALAVEAALLTVQTLPAAAPAAAKEADDGKQ